MNRWRWLLLMGLCWVGAGFAIFGLRQSPIRGDTHPPSYTGRVVSMAPNLTEILFALGLDDRIVGVTLDSNYPREAAKKPKVGTFWQPNIEAVIAAKPDLVITLGFQRQRSFAERLRRVGYKTLVLSIENVSELFEAIKKIGVATAKQHEANGLVSAIRQKLDGLSAQFGTSDRPRVLWIVQRQPLRVAGTNTFINEMIELAGGQNAIGPTMHSYPPIGAEQVYACRVDVIIEPSMEQEGLAGQRNAALQYWSRFANVPAVVNKRVYIIPGDTVSRLGPRLGDGIETIARCLRPQLFGG